MRCMGEASPRAGRGPSLVFGTGCALTLMARLALRLVTELVTDICGFKRVGVASALATNSDSPRFLLSSAWQIGVLRLIVR